MSWHSPLSIILTRQQFIADAVGVISLKPINTCMRVVLILPMLLAGCAGAPILELSQSMEERASGVVYAVAEPPVPEIPVAVLRPQPRPDIVVPVSTVVRGSNQNPLHVAQQFLGLTEYSDRVELREFMGVDPRQTEWCAAFVNSVLAELGQPGSESVSDHPLMARSFLEWGVPVDHKEQEPSAGDVVVFPRGRQSWQGHVGFYVDTVTIDGKDYWRILGGNQSNAVTIELYTPERALAVRRAPKPVVEARNLLDIIRSWFV